MFHTLLQLALLNTAMLDKTAAMIVVNRASDPTLTPTRYTIPGKGDKIRTDTIFVEKACSSVMRPGVQSVGDS
jgi:hypothetical protein